VGGKNAPQDTLVVQQQLLMYGFDVGKADGVCNKPTIRGIMSFQGGFMRVPDGRVDPGGTTWSHLLQLSSAEAALNAKRPFVRPILKPAPGFFNFGLQTVSSKFMVETLGEPRDSYSQNDQPLTNTKLKRNLITTKVGQLHVCGLRPAVASLQAVVDEIALNEPEVYAVLGTAGMLCCRYQRGSSTAISNHSWGTAIDLTVSGVLDQRGDGRVQYGLSLIALIFNRHGWYWGAGFHVEDGMHFEGSRAAVEDWAIHLV
jgi:hypothetical protein